MADDLNLLDRIKRGSYEVSIATSYNTYLPFYEDVVLRRLAAAGCRANVVLMDQRQLSHSLLSPDLRPRMAGYEYTLMGINAPAAFHPKIILLAGSKGGLAIVGSHNLTFSGFGHNREVSTLVSISGPRDTEAVGFGRQVWAFLRSWIHHEQGRIAPEVIASAERAANTVKWLRGKPTTSSSLEFIGKLPDGPSLWSQLKSTLPDSVSRLILVGPFFDKELRLPLAMREDLGSTEIVVGIDPATVEINAKAHSGTGIRFVNAHDFGPHSRYLHAKIAYFEDVSGEKTLILGSANPSSPAWLEDGSAGNAEAVVVHRGNRAREIAESLGLASLADGPALEESDWVSIQERKPQEREQQDPGQEAVAIGVAVEGGVRIDDSRFSRLQAEGAFILHADGASQKIDSPIQRSDSGVFISLDAESRTQARLVEIRCSGGTSLLALIHHGEQLDSRCQTSRQSELRTALASLEGEGADIASLVTLVDKMIFSPDAQVHPPAPKPAKSAASGSSEESQAQDEQPIDSLAASIQDSKKAKVRQRRLAQDGDLGAILDFLIYHLGVDPYRSTAGLDSKGRNEEERTGSDDDAESSPSIHLDILQNCQRKVRSLVTRMAKQLSLVRDDDSSRATVIVQLCAVLSVLRELRVADRNSGWVGPGQTLVPSAERQRLLEVALGYLFGEGHQLLRMTIEDRDGEIFDEVSRLKGLMLWLAWDGGLRGDQAITLRDTPEERRAKLLNRSRIVIASRHVAIDRVASAEAKESIIKVARETDRASAVGWLARGIAAGEEVNAALSKAQGSSSDQIELPRVGDLVIVPKCCEPLVVVREKQGPAGEKKDTVFLADLDHDTPDKGYRSDRARVVLSRPT